MQGNKINNKEQVSIVGEDNEKLISSVTTCLLLAGHSVTLYTNHEKEVKKSIEIHLENLRNRGYSVSGPVNLQMEKELDNRIDNKLIIVLTEERIDNKKNHIERIEQCCSSTAIIAINSESISLEVLQKDSKHPERIMGLNWTEPAHTTAFLELIKNESTEQGYIEQLFYLSKEFWHKDPYVINGNYGVRSKLLSAMAREAFYLVENGVASVGDIDRACRNDAGYYLPFAGNCRYMDLMGTYIYGVVMKDLNPDLSKEKEPPVFFEELLHKGGKGMENNKGFYSYEQDEVEEWNKKFQNFSYQIKAIMDKYPFGY